MPAIALGLAVVLLITYALNLAFMLKTHPAAFAEAEERFLPDGLPWREEAATSTGL